jgi:Fe-S-cluster-containing dehydrogenase component/CRP-like cAMP-binding protein
MSEQVAQHLDRPRRWDAPFDPAMSEASVDELLARPEFSAIDASRFPAAAPLRGILLNDCRISVYQPGELIVREGDYGNSAFLILSGDVRVVISPGLPQQALGRAPAKKRKAFSVLRDMLTYNRVVESRDTSLYGSLKNGGKTAADTHASLLNAPDKAALFGAGVDPLANPERLAPLVDLYKTALLPSGTLFGEIAALGRVQRSATVYAETQCRVLELRWQALRDIKNRDDKWREKIETVYRANLLKTHLPEHPLLAGLDAETLKKIADQTLFETFGSFEWNVDFKAGKKQKRRSSDIEPLVAREGEYPDGLLMVIGGFGRVTVSLGNGQRTLTYLRQGDHFGLDELFDTWKLGEDKVYESSLHALGYLQLLRIPYSVLVELVFPRLVAPANRLIDAASRPIEEDAFMEWAVDQRFINGTKTMLIDMEKCVRCDDCVTACAETHDGNPRFIRSGASIANWMVATACMHCVDPVCLIGCPTGAIHRTMSGGTVIINDQTCIGCGTCANACPYDNIHLVPIREKNGQAVIDPGSKQPIMKATKCDLCSSLPSGPSCERACSHGALQRIDLQSLIKRAQIGA